MQPRDRQTSSSSFWSAEPSPPGTLSGYLLPAIGLIATDVLLTIVIDATTRLNVVQAAEAASKLIGAVGTLSFLGVWIHGFWRRGRVHLDLGPYPNRWVVVGLLAVFGFLGARGNLDKEFLLDVVPVWGFLLMGLLVVASLLEVLGRLQVTEHGVWRFWRLLRFEDLDSYRWSDESDLVLIGKKRLDPVGTVQVPTEHHASLEERLEGAGVPRSDLEL